MSHAQSTSKPSIAEYAVTGMSCGGCVAGVKKKLEALPEVESAEVQLEGGRVRLSLKQAVEIEELQTALGGSGYGIALV